MQVYECLDAILKHGQHFLLEIEGRERGIHEFAHNEELAILQAPAEFHWENKQHPKTGEEVGCILYEPVRRQGQVLNHHKRKIIVRYSGQE